MKRHLSFVAALGICFVASIAAAHAQVRADTQIGGCQSDRLMARKLSPSNFGLLQQYLP